MQIIGGSFTDVGRDLNQTLIVDQSPQTSELEPSRECCVSDAQGI